MTFTLNRRSAASLGRWAIGMRLFSAVALDGAPLGNSGWISLALAGLMSLPLVLMISFMSRAQPEASPISLIEEAIGLWARRTLCLVLSMFSLYEAGVSTRMAVTCAEYVAFHQTPTLVLTLLPICVCGIACLRGGLGVSGASQVLRYLFFLLIGGMIIVEIGSMNWRWLMPVLGPGVDPLLRAALSYSGMTTALASIWLCMGEETGLDRTGGTEYKKTGPFYPLKILGVITLGAVIAALLLTVLAPSLPGGPNARDFALDKLLANGLSGAPLQLPLMLVWFLAQALMLAFYIYTASFLLKNCFEKLPWWACVLVVSAVTAFLAFSGITDRAYIDKVNALIRYPAVNVILFAVGAVSIIKQRGKRVAKG